MVTFNTLLSSARQTHGITVRFKSLQFAQMVSCLKSVYIPMNYVRIENLRDSSQVMAIFWSEFFLCLYRYIWLLWFETPYFCCKYNAYMHSQLWLSGLSLMVTALCVILYLPLLFLQPMCTTHLPKLNDTCNFTDHWFFSRLPCNYSTAVSLSEPTTHFV